MLAYISMSAYHPPTQLIINLTHTMCQMKPTGLIWPKLIENFKVKKLIKSEAISRKN